MPQSRDITRMTVLGPGDLLTAIRVPGTWSGARFTVADMYASACGKDAYFHLEAP